MSDPSQDENQEQHHDSQLYERMFGAIDSEVARLSFLCGIKLLDAGVIERVIRGDQSVCAQPNAKLFQTLRGLVALHYNLTDASLSAIGPDESAKVLGQLRARLAKRFALRSSAS